MQKVSKHYGAHLKCRSQKQPQRFIKIVRQPESLRKIRVFHHMKPQAILESCSARKSTTKETYINSLWRESFVPRTNSRQTFQQRWLIQRPTLTIPRCSRYGGL